ncbi:sigma-54-dependent transcriptional regulator [Aestuariispira insulae]|uniref:DNA-binding NtrC family response regulator n=1 Tax=Aestuariispira insulae TaxID=1461337 RepID=A0A3D9HSU5_9PROT|nr:sigma-54 dependent transcriptional regulator [Aestuariispira insulae]RED52421.1 DNA-binding NtrC family response regulator [Aestuariispira insulae]
MRLLIIGTLDGHMTTAGQIAHKRGAKVVAVESLDGALSNLRAGQGADLIMVDVRMRIDLLVKQLETERIHVPVVACGIEGTSAEEAAQAIQKGAKEYIPLPPDPEMIAAVLEAVAQEDSAIIHRDPATKQVLKLADQIAPSDASILITGESGTGKEVMARYLHNKSRRSSGNFVAINCAAIPENLLESELFGHEKGAFSGAVARRIGKFEEADGGTILLDEISEMDLRLQAKLLRVIQEREVDRVGGSKPVKVDVRILATSNRDMEQTIKEGNFREDLYFRLNVVNIQLPSLRERRQDIVILAEHFAKKYAEANGVPEKPLSGGAIAMLERHNWPGNVRELENTMHRAILLAHGSEIDESAIILTGSQYGQANMAAAVSAQPTTGDSQPAEETQAEAVSADQGDAGEGMTDANGNLVGRTVADVERQLIIDTLDHCLGNRTHAANILGISIRTLRNKLKLYADDGFNVPEPGAGQ